jgi:hypothetical protein
MTKILLFLNSIDWIFASVLLIGGRYWGGKYFTISKTPALNFLLFANVFGVLWLLIRYITVGIAKSDIENLFITYLFTTSFYELFAKKFFEMIENWMGYKHHVTPKI